MDRLLQEKWNALNIIHILASHLTFWETLKFLSTLIWLHSRLSSYVYVLEHEPSVWPLLCYVFIVLIMHRDLKNFHFSSMDTVAGTNYKFDGIQVYMKLCVLGSIYAPLKIDSPTAKFNRPFRIEWKRALNAQPYTQGAFYLYLALLSIRFCGAVSQI